MFPKILIEHLNRIAREYGIELAVLLAVVDVESGGKVGARLGSRFEPMIRFEAHYFHKLLPADLRNRAVREGLASPIAGEIGNPQDQTLRWKMVSRASRIDRTAALSSVSWGIGQVMGSHWDWLGYENIDALVNEARSGVVGQVKLMMRYVEKAGLIESLVVRNWAKFARVYNGPAFKKYQYDEKLEDAYQRHVARCPGLR